MKVTLKFLKGKSACSEGLEFVQEKKLIGLNDIYFIKKLMKFKKYQWANWLIVRCMEYKQYVSYAVFAAEQVIDIYEKKYPDDKRPREAIEAAKKCIKNPSKKNKNAAAYAAADAAYAYAAADDAAYAYAAAAAYAAADDDAAYAAYAAAADDDAAKEKMQIKILNYGLKLLK